MDVRPFKSFAVMFVAGGLIAAAVPTILPAQAPAAAHTQPDSPYGGQTVEDIIARVNERIISRSDYERAEEEMDQEGRQHGLSMQEVADSKKDLLRNLIDQQLWLSKGKELDINHDVELELVRQLDEIRKKYNLSTMEDLEKAAKEQGVSFEDFKANIRNNITTQMVMRKEVGEHIQVTPGESERYFEEHKQDYVRPESVRLSEILVSTGDAAPSATGGEQPVSESAINTARSKADDIEAKLKSGADFAQLARTSSDGPTAAQGGDLGSFQRGKLAKTLEDATFALKTGEVTAPIRTKQGFVILKVNEHIPGGTPAFKDVQPEVEEAYYMSRMEPAIRAYLTQMREEAFIDIKPGYTDSGASAKQTKPVYSAYVPPSAKKKRKLERTRYRETGRGFRQKDATPAEQAQNDAQATKDAKVAKAKKKNVTQTATTQQAGKREKIRFGQAPRETLPDAPTATKKEDAGALPEQTAQANADDAAVDTAPEAPKKKTRFSATAPKPKTPKAPSGSDAASAKKAANSPAPPDAAEVADRKAQSAPLGLNGDTATKQKKSTEGVTGDKTRFSDRNKKPADDSQQQQPAPATTPAQPNNN